MKEMRTVVTTKTGRSIVLTNEIPDEVTLPEMGKELWELVELVTGYDHDGNLIVIPKGNVEYLSIQIVTMIE